jgi:hypothetical protein
MKDSHGDILDSIREEKTLSDENEKKLKDVLEQFSKNYEPQNTGAVDASVGGEDDEESADENGSEEGS